MLVAVGAAALPVAAHAQDAALDPIEAIERQILGPQSKFQRLKNELRDAEQQLRQSRDEVQQAREEAREAREVEKRARQEGVKAADAEVQARSLPPYASSGGLGTGAPQAQAAAAAPPAAAVAAQGIKVSMPDRRPTIATGDDRLSLAIGGLMQFDMGGYFQNPNPNTQYPELNNGVNLRRGRIYFVGKFDDFRVNITPDFGGSPVGSPTLYEANINYTGIKPITATVGYFHPFVSLEDVCGQFAVS